MFQDYYSNFVYLLLSFPKRIKDIFVLNAETETNKI